MTKNNYSYSTFYRKAKTKYTLLALSYCAVRVHAVRTYVGICECVWEKVEDKCFPNLLGSFLVSFCSKKKARRSTDKDE